MKTPTIIACIAAVLFITATFLATSETNTQLPTEEPAHQTIQPVSDQVTAPTPVTQPTTQTVKADAQPAVQIQDEEISPALSNVQEIKRATYGSLLQQPTQSPTPPLTATLAQATATTPPARATTQDIAVQRNVVSAPRVIPAGTESITSYTVRNNSIYDCYLMADLKGEAMNSGVGTDWKVDGDEYTREKYIKLEGGEQIEFYSRLQYPNLSLSLVLCLLTEAIPLEGRISQGPSGSERITFYEDKIDQALVAQSVVGQLVVQSADQQVAIERKGLSREGNITVAYSLKNNGSSDCYILPTLEVVLPSRPGETIGCSFTQYLGDAKYPGPNENYLKLQPGDAKVIRWVIDTSEYPVKVNFFNLPQAIPISSEVSQGASGSPKDTIFEDTL